MNEKDFGELVTSIEQAEKIRRGELAPGRVTEFPPTEVKAIRSRLSLSQSEFALMIGVSIATLQNWEQGRRRPEGTVTRNRGPVVIEAVVKAPADHRLSSQPGGRPADMAHFPNFRKPDTLLSRPALRRLAAPGHPHPPRLTSRLGGKAPGGYPGALVSEPTRLAVAAARISITAPSAGMRVLRDPETPPDRTTLALRAVVDPPVEQLVWYVDGAPRSVG